MCSALGSISPPAASYSASANPAPMPAPFSITTRWPFDVSSRTVEGTTPTRYSLSLISFGTPTSMAALPLPAVARAPRERPRFQRTLFLDRLGSGNFDAKAGETDVVVLGGGHEPDR